MTAEIRMPGGGDPIKLKGVSELLDAEGKKLFVYPNNYPNEAEGFYKLDPDAISAYKARQLGTWEASKQQEFIALYGVLYEPGQVIQLQGGSMLVATTSVDLELV